MQMHCTLREMTSEKVWNAGNSVSASSNVFAQNRWLAPEFQVTRYAGLGESANGRNFITELNNYTQRHHRKTPA
jgi:hypothetical protein